MQNAAFSKTKYFIIDMDGTFYLDGNLIDGALDFLARVKQLGKDFFFFTNNSSNNVEVCRQNSPKWGAKYRPKKSLFLPM